MHDVLTDLSAAEEAFDHSKQHLSCVLNEYTIPLLTDWNRSKSASSTDPADSRPKDGDRPASSPASDACVHRAEQATPTDTSASGRSDGKDMASDSSHTSRGDPDVAGVSHAHAGALEAATWLFKEIGMCLEALGEKG